MLQSNFWKKLIVTRLVKKFLPFMELYSRETATGPYPEPDESSRDISTLFT
jgi:hypothetical protein